MRLSSAPAKEGHMYAGVKISIIAAISRNGVIGRGEDIPWKLGADLEHFKKITTGKTVIVGRKTHESILRRLGKNLPDRRTIVLTRNPYYRPERCTVVGCWQDAIQAAQGETEIFVIGGRDVYKVALECADILFITAVEANVPGDTMFPEYDPKQWTLTSFTRHESDEKNEYNFSFQTFQKRETFPPC